jgi:DNA-3-methyladenine glycosylase
VPRRLARATLARSAFEVAPDLLGAVIARREDDGTVTRAVLVETEAYGPDDPASHAFPGPTPRNRAMFARAGTLYVYLVYGVHHCANVVTSVPGVGSAVLLRAAEPVEGLERMRARRPGASDRDLCRGPGRLAAALGLTRRSDGEDLIGGERVWLERGRPVDDIVAGPRVGIRVATARPWRFAVAGSRFVSGPAPAGFSRRSAGRS